ncbi:MAG: hypothetical protein ACE5GW_00335 [Planctomycetota bacterium]
MLSAGRRIAGRFGSDVFSLGVILHELITGARPDAFSDGSSPGCAVDAERVASALMARAVARDLAHVVRRAIEARAEDRYPAVEELALDLRRFLEGFPVEARPAGIGHRAGLFLRRNRAPAGLICGAFLALAVGFLVSFRGSTTAGSFRDQASRRLESTLSACAFLLEELEGLSAAGTEPIRLRCFEGLSLLLSDLARERPGDPAIEELKARAERLRTGAR